MLLYLENIFNDNIIIIYEIIISKIENENKTKQKHAKRRTFFLEPVTVGA